MGQLIGIAVVGGMKLCQPLHLRHEIGAAGAVLVTAIILDIVVLSAFAVLKWQSDPLIVVISFALMAAVFVFERLYLRHDANHGIGIQLVTTNIAWRLYCHMLSLDT